MTIRNLPPVRAAASLTALAVITALALPMIAGPAGLPDGKAWAAGHGEGKGGDDKGGHETGGGDDKGREGKGEPERKGVDLDSLKGEKQGSERPVWAQEGIPEVELGRLSVARSPDQVLDRAYLEALNTLTSDMVDFYSLSLNEMIYELSVNFDSLSFIDSPLQNLALLQDILEDGTSTLISDPKIGVDNTTGTLMAVFIGTASDKTIPITADTVVAVTTILGTPITGDDAELLAAAAEAIRVAILAGHG